MSYGSTLDGAAIKAGLDALSRPAKAGKLSVFALKSDLTSDEEMAISEHDAFLQEYLDGAAVYVQQGTTLADYVSMRIADVQGVWPDATRAETFEGGGFIGTRLSTDLASALEKASANVRQHHPVLSATGLYLE